MKRVLAICMTCALLLGLLSTAALAAEGKPTDYGISIDDDRVTSENIKGLLPGVTVTYCSGADSDGITTLWLSGSIHINKGQTLTVDRGMLVSLDNAGDETSTLTNNGTLVVNGRLGIDSGEWANNGTITVGATGSMDNRCTLTNNGTLNVLGYFFNDVMVVSDGMEGGPIDNGKIIGGGSINGIITTSTNDWNDGNYTTVHTVYGDAVMSDSFDLENYTSQSGDTHVSTMTIPTGATLTILNGVTLNVRDMNCLTIEDGGGIVLEGTLKLPEGTTKDQFESMDIQVTNGGKVQAGDVTLVEAPYPVTVNGGTGGGEYAAGATVTISADVPSGQRFTSWTVDAGDVTLTSTSSATTTFVMPAQAVTVTANFEDIPTYLVTVNGGTGGGEYAAGATVTISADVPSGQRFTSWTVDAGDVTLASASSETTIFTMPAQAVTVTANFENIPTYLVTVNGGTGGGEYAAGATVTISADVPSGQRFTSGTVDEGGVTLANASSATTTFVMPAQAVTVTAHFQSNSGGGGGGTSTTITTYPPTAVQPSEGGTVTVSPSQPERGDKVTIRPAPATGYEVAEVNVTDRNGKPVEVKTNSDGTYSFVQPSGKVKIEVTYKPVKPAETPWSNPFPDVSESAWYYDAVRYAQENGLMSGYGNGNFGPDDQLSRAMLAQILYNKEGRPVVTDSAFDDVADGAWYADAITWAAANGIVSGYGNGKFGPNDNITREQLAVMLWHYVGSPAATDKELHFTDADEASGYALEALRWAVENGIINGYGDGRFDPRGSATRAQVAQMLKNFLENQ